MILGKKGWRGITKDGWEERMEVWVTDDGWEERLEVWVTENGWEVGKKGMVLVSNG